MSVETLNIDNIAYKEFNNVLVYNIMRDKLFKNNDMLSSILTE